MNNKGILGFTNKRDLATLAVFATTFGALLAVHTNAWIVVSVTVLFIGYTSWADAAFLVRHNNCDVRHMTTLALPVGMAVFKVLLCLGLVWLVVWFARR